GDWQEARRDGPEQDDDDRDDPRQDRSVDEETRQHDRSPFRRSAIGARRQGLGAAFARRAVALECPTSAGGLSTLPAATVMPGRTCCRPLTITRSPGFRPSVISRRPSWSAPIRTGRDTTSFLSLTT